MLSSLMQKDARKLDQLLGMVAYETKYLQTTGHQIRSQVSTNTSLRTYPGGIRRSVSTSPEATGISSTASSRLDCTLTTTRAGFRKPALTSSDIASASVIVALNKPVLLCLGSLDRILVKLF